MMVRRHYIPDQECSFASSWMRFPAFYLNIWLICRSRRPSDRHNSSYEVDPSPAEIKCYLSYNQIISSYLSQAGLHDITNNKINHFKLFITGRIAGYYQ